MRNLHIFIFAIALSNLSLNTATAAYFCEDALKRSARFSEYLAAEKTLESAINKLIETQIKSASTTSLRNESKFVIDSDNVDPLIELLKERFPENFQLRDKTIPGRKNVTETEYELPVKFKTADGQVKSAKFRLRVYKTADVETLVKDALLETAEFIEGKQFVEWKMDHPEHVGVVVKSRLLMDNTDIKILLNAKKLFAGREALISRISLLNSKTSPELIENFVDSVGAVYKQTKLNTFQKFANTKYVRDSFSLMLKDTIGKPVEIQFTIDQEISVTDQNTGKIILAYDQTRAVIEVKVPLKYAGLTLTDLLNVEGLEVVKEVIELLTGLHDSNYKEGSGKIYSFKRILKKPSGNR